MYLIINCIICEGTYRTRIICITGINTQRNPPKHEKLFKGKYSSSPFWINQGKKTPTNQTVLKHVYVLCDSDYMGKLEAQRLPVFLIFFSCFSRKPNIKYLANKPPPAVDPTSFDVHLLQMTQSNAHMPALRKQECRSFNKPPSAWGWPKKDKTPCNSANKLYPLADVRRGKGEQKPGGITGSILSHLEHVLRF